jgi:hypothetical protein
MYVHTATDQLRKQVLLKLKICVSYYFDITSFWQLDSCRLSYLLFDILWLDNLSFDNLSLSQNSIIYLVRHFGILCTYIQLEIRKNVASVAKRQHCFYYCCTQLVGDQLKKVSPFSIEISEL